MGRKTNAIISIRYIFLLSLFFPQVVMAQLQADFSATPLTGCPPMVINFKDISAGGPTTWRWNFGNGDTSNIQNPIATYTNPGSYNVQLIVKNASGTASTIKNQYIIVNALPVAAFNASATRGCFPLKVNFTDQSLAGSGTITAWEWDFGDGAVSTEQNPVHIYTLGGSFRVILKVTNSNGCVQVVSRSNYIILKNGVKADFDYTSAGSCGAPAPVSFINKSTGTGDLKYEWNFGDGDTSNQPNPDKTYQNPGAYSVKLVVINSYGCSDTLIKPNAINIGLIKADFSKPDVACAGNAFQLTNTSNPSSFAAASWDFGDGTTSDAASPFKNYSQPGSYNIKMVANFGSCKDSTVKAITILPKPLADFTAINNNGCTPPLNVSFNSGAGDSVSYQWDFGDGTAMSTLPNPGHTYLSSGGYSVTLITTNAAGCTDTIVKQNFVKVVPPKIIALSNLPVKGCVPITITPVAVTQDSIAADSYLWDFGDGTTSPGPTPSHIYTLPGVYNVKLITVTSGCTDSLIIIGAVKAGTKPIAAFKADSRKICASKAVAFTDRSTGAPGTEWLWSFGDGSFATEQNPFHKYGDTGYFRVSLVVANYGCSDTLEKKNYVYVKPPAARYTASFLCSTPLKRVFTDKSAGATSWTWNFGDGSPLSANKKPSHTYAMPGSYPVMLVVANDNCIDSVTTNVVVIKEQGKLGAGNPVSCINTGTVFTVTNINPANIRSYTWYSDSITQRTAPANYTNPFTAKYTAAGARLPAVVMTDILNCRDTLYNTAAPVIIYGAKAAFQSPVAGTCPGNTITFNDLTKTDGIHPVANWSWNFGDGVYQSYSTGPFAHQYKAQGLFGVSLAITDSYGCRDSIFKPGIITIARPSAKFTQSDTLICPNTNITFYNKTAGLRNTYFWQFGDSATSNDINPQHTYINEGKYQVTLSVINEYGCSDSLISFVSVVKTTAGFLMSDSFVNCPPLTVKFTNTSKGYSKLIWDFDDEAGSTLINPSHIFTTPGNYTIKLRAENNTGCSDTAVRKLVVKGPNGTFNYTPLSICAPDKVNFTANVETAVKFYWNYQEGNADSTSQKNSFHVYTTPGLYVPKVVVEDSTGCRFIITGKDTIVVDDIKTKILSDKNILCDSGTIHFTDSTISYQGKITYKWSFGDGATSDLKSPDHTFSQTGSYNVKLQVTTESGCTDSASVVIKVAKSPSISILARNISCSNESVIFLTQFAGDTSAIKFWNWNFGNGNTSSLPPPRPQTYNTPGNYNVSLSATNSNGCVAAVTKPIVIYPAPSLTTARDKSICAGNNVSLSVAGAVSYTWSPAAGLSCTGCANPTANPAGSITYHVKGTSANGCSSIDSVAVRVLSPYNVLVSADTAVCIGTPVQLTAKGAVNYKWSPSEGLSSVSASNPVATPATTTTYRVIGYDAGETLICANDTGSVTVTVYSKPSVDLGPDKTLSTRSSAVLTPALSGDVINLRWSPGTGLSCTDCPKPEFIARNNISYKLIVQNEHCSAEDAINIIVTYDNRGVIIPNAFSPNGDGINDVFYPTGNNASFVKSFTIYNRWGKQIFAVNNVPGNDPAYGWNGTWKGVSAEVGVYYYIAELINANNKTIQYTGHVTLVK